MMMTNNEYEYAAAFDIYGGVILMVWSEPDVTLELSEDVLPPYTSHHCISLCSSLCSLCQWLIGPILRASDQQRMQ